ncbi:carboxypeptidase regulatory-like domain-containing protein [Oceanithermus sp.]|uniref:carboxypeptidase regulatory-like domain-containing protein n=1 Tax=Oceanithermus sp. TaxID=2268145 RepID=UPI0025798602|nr:carboxypeptidase regulatory-like domain-containing protein [Oceanithermus sp.]
MHWKNGGFLVLAALTLALSACGGVAVPRGDATLNGTVVDATTGLPVQGAKACFVYNGNVSQLCDNTDANGEFVLQLLPAGDHAVQVHKGGFTVARESVSLTDGAATTVRIALNPGLSSGELRIVLSWNADPRDLDSHLWIPQGSGYDEVYYRSKGNCDAAPYACLDVDDTSGYGPETITVARPQTGVYSYAVHWYAGTGSWAASGGTVHVYDASGLIATYTAPANAGEPGAGGLVWWYVFDMDGGALLPKNTLSSNPPQTSGVASLGVK